jgi:hypothetical protein
MSSRYPETTYVEYVNIASAYYKRWKRGGLRKGQAYFNSLDGYRPDLAKQVGGHTDLDPFYKDENLVPFLKFIQENW